MRKKWVAVMLISTMLFSGINPTVLSAAEGQEDSEESFDQQEEDAFTEAESDEGFENVEPEENGLENYDSKVITESMLFCNELNDGPVE